MKYRNTITGVVVNVQSEVKGNWELIPDSLEPAEKAQAEEKGLDKDVEFYLQFFRYGCPPHGGFGLGVDRMTMLLLGLTIKESMFIFRGPDRLNP